MDIAKTKVLLLFNLGLAGTLKNNINQIGKFITQDNKQRYEVTVGLICT